MLYFWEFCQTPLQLANLTQLELVGVGVDFVFPQEGRKEEGMNPHLASTRGNDPLCLKLVDCLVGVWKVVWQVSVDFLVGVLCVS